MLNMLPVRYVFAFVGFWGAFCAFLLKINLSVAIVDMVDFEVAKNNSKDEQADLSRNNTDIQMCPDRGAAAERNSTVSQSERRFIWNGSLQGFILGSYSYGVVLALIAMAYASRRFGHVRVLGVAMLTSSVVTLLIPVLTETGGYIALVIMRLIIGMLTGAAITVLIGLAGKWSPPQERSKIISLILAEIPVGTSCVLPIAGILAAALGWKWVFYFTGGFSAFWALLWLALIHETPEQHPRITQEEKNFIISSLQSTKMGIEENRVSPPIPWKSIFKSRAVVCLALVHFTSYYGRTTMAFMLPTYLKTVLQFDVQMAGIFSALPFMTSGIFLFCTGPLADFIISKGMRSIIVRKAYTATGMFSSGIAIIVAGYSECDAPLAIFLFTTVVAMDAFCIPGFRPCYAEIAPEFCGVVFSISATLANTTGILAPQIAGSLRQAYGILGWRIAFWIAGILYFLGAAQFVIFGSNEMQPWAAPKQIRPSVTTITHVLEEEDH